MFQSLRNPAGNKLLAALPAEEYQRLKPVLEAVTLPFKQYLYHCNQPIEYVYFPNRGVISVVALLADGGSAEVAMTGSEGMVGISILLGGIGFPMRLLCGFRATPCE
ncbi:Crp/Fnr family transcriptional regulator [Kamptonema formosum]|uniref:Crp/Fnr family transcriptional regulator n=1 Tax=Kamptonema formosum TaxID=331992 RepID=UPI0012DBF62D|nr:Crp/Fnr family transcriptional regulator [Oscillatoria sp. PCC 10802]